VSAEGKRSRVKDSRGGEETTGRSEKKDNYFGLTSQDYSEGRKAGLRTLLKKRGFSNLT